MKPGAGLAVATLAKPDISSYVTQGKALTFVDFITHVVPSSMMDAFVRGDMPQVVFIAVLFGAGLAMLGESGAPRTDVLEVLSRVFFRIVAIIMVVAPIGAFGAMAYTIGAFGVSALLPLGRLMLGVYTTMALFIFIVLNLILRMYGFSLWQYLSFIREEILIVLGTSSSEAALPRMLAKMERYGCAKPVVGLVIPAGYSFNLDGTSIYLSMASIFIAQAFIAHERHTAGRVAGRTHADVQGRGGRDRFRIHRAGQHSLGAADRADRGNRASAGCRSFHE